VRRQSVVQAVALGVTAAALWWLGHNTANTLDQHGISLGFGFLRQPANFEIGDAPIAYSPADTFVRAILVGLANTARVSVLGWILAIALGFVLGILRLATNPAVRGVARGIVELVRNVPLLLLLLFLAATMHTLPPARGALEPLPSVFVSDRGLVMPSLSGAAVSRLPAAHYAVGSAVNQATRQIGAVIGVAITVVLLGHGIVQRSDFDAVYGLHIGLALLTAVLCLFVNTRPPARPA